MNRQISQGYVSAIRSEVLIEFMVLQQKRDLLKGEARYFTFRKTRSQLEHTSQIWKFAELWNNGSIGSKYFMDGLGADLMIYRSGKILLEYDAQKYLLNHGRFEIITDKENNPIRLLPIKEQ